MACDSNGICYPDTAPSCIAPLIWRCQTNSYGGQVCGCVPLQTPEPVCEVRIIYTDPQTPTIQSSSACDAAGVELALAVMLAKLLGAR